MRKEQFVICKSASYWLVPKNWEILTSADVIVTTQMNEELMNFFQDKIYIFPTSSWIDSICDFVKSQKNKRIEVVVYEYSDMSRNALEHAIKNGYKDTYHMLNDSSNKWIHPDIIFLREGVAS